MSEVRQAKLPSTDAPPSILLGMTAVTGMVDAEVFWRARPCFHGQHDWQRRLPRIRDRAAGLSVSGSLMALICFAVDALLGGWMTRKMIPQGSGATLAHALVIETIFFFFAAAVSIGFTAP
jgi:hypothetical protein